MRLDEFQIRFYATLHVLLHDTSCGARGSLDRSRTDLRSRPVILMCRVLDSLPMDYGPRVQPPASPPKPNEPQLSLYERMVPEQLSVCCLCCEGNGRAGEIKSAIRYVPDVCITC